MLSLVRCWFWSWCLSVLGHGPCSCTACVFSRCAPNRVNNHQVVHIAGCFLNTCPCVLERMIAVLTMSCFPHDFLALVLNSYSSGTSSHLSTGGSLHEQVRLYTWGKTVLASQIKRWALSWLWPFRRKSCHPRLSLLSSAMATVKKSSWSIRICRKGTEEKRVLLCYCIDLLSTPAFLLCVVRVSPQMKVFWGWKRSRGVEELPRREQVSKLGLFSCKRNGWWQVWQPCRVTSGQRNWIGMNLLTVPSSMRAGGY